MADAFEGLQGLRSCESDISNPLALKEIIQTGDQARFACFLGADDRDYARLSAEQQSTSFRNIEKISMGQPDPELSGALHTVANVPASGPDLLSVMRAFRQLQSFDAFASIAHPALRVGAGNLRSNRSAHIAQLKVASRRSR